MPASTRYFDKGSENSEDYGGGLNGRLDVLADTKLTGGASYDLETEAREAETALRNTINPVQFGVWQAQASGSHQFNRLQISLERNLGQFQLPRRARSPGHGGPGR